MKGDVMADIKNKDDKAKLVPVKDLTICEATQEMITKGRSDGVDTAFDRAVNMKACPIGADSACCKHCFMGPCRLNARDPYGKVGVCGATIDTIMARNFARMVAAGGAAHTDHGMSMVDLFREVVNGNIKDYRIKDTQKLEAVAQSIGIETEGRSIKDIAVDLYTELERTYTQVEGEIPFTKRVPPTTLETWR
jgi:carbon-monoxide dehydrogenase catalytic subunit